MARRTLDPHPQLGLLKQLHLAGGGTLVLFGAAFLVLGLRGGALVEGAYALLTGLSLLALQVFGRGVRAVSWFHVVAVMIVPFAVTLTLGGLAASGGFMVWGLMGPLAAMMFLGRRALAVTGGLFLALLVISAVLSPSLLGPLAQLPPAWLLPVLAASNLAGASILILATLHHFVQRMHQDQERADALLLNIMPPELAQALRPGGRERGAGGEGVTVLFADVLDLAPLDAPLDDAQIVDMLNAVYTHFDTLAERHGLARIKTVADAYMVVAGAPGADLRHAHRAAALALDMRAAVASRGFAGHRIDLRVGINSGVIRPDAAGRRGFIYDVWGRTVHLASHLEPRGGPGCIRVTAATRALIQDEYACEPAGVQVLRDAPVVEVWTLIDRLDAQSSQPSTSAAQTPSEASP
ncbi:MAG: adenylate/guanylate cyclase domain-containing protein [Pseudomonadota bacterium]